ncbi:DUF3019 domain-containing protein [Psychrobium sp. MM17-31]|uniref:DUF3019 domain-containing protein n=1 Tax=Psychrobium sp. MM17-31 TaxID=2917758 RepID=UPI001EF608A4|nr:DUF3019 domain-containing protein [Psychrobium sp. MM17-31]MCG7532388.1 DUF3019 domain-containing protein [Psychrobium sp. MM17-31]
MKSIVMTVFAFLVTVGSLTSAAQAMPATPDPKLVVQPEQCVAMKQGNPCFASVEIAWKMPEQGHYCLYSNMQQQAIRCWKNHNAGQAEFEVKATNNVVFTIRQANEESVLATGLMKLAWVYKKKGQPRRSWRLF